MARIPDDIIEAVRHATDVSELVGRYLPLRRTGRTYKGLCPFHQEKTPSFQVWPETGTWRCFGCGKGGNVFSFVQEREGVPFPEAVRQLARDGGISLPEDDDPEAAARSARAERVRRVVEWACVAFEAALRAPEGARAREYFKGRGIAGATAKAFRLGYAPPGWDRLLVAARRDAVAEADLLDAGLVIQREGREGSYDRFRDRVVFPIHDAQGRVIAFGARTLGDDEPKYLNSPETPVFTKGKNLYAFHLAKHEMLRTGEGAVMEGYTDVILAHQAGFKVAVAGLGTALTPDQARKLAPYVKKLYLVYDGDAAGLRAAEKAIPAFLPEPIETRVCVLPGGKDPADVFVEDGEAAFRSALAGSREAFDHLLAVRAAANDVATVPGKTAAIEEALAALVGVKDEMRRALYVRRLADEYGVPEDVASRKLHDLRARARPAERERGDDASHGPGDRRGASHGASAGGAAGGSAGGSAGGPSAASAAASRRPAGPVGYAADGPFPPDPPALDAGADDVHEQVEGGPSDGPRRASAAPEPPAGPAPPIERALVEALLGAPGLVGETSAAVVAALAHGPCRRIADLLVAARGAAGEAPDVTRVLGTLDDPSLAAFGAELLETGHGKRLVDQGRDCIRRLAALHEERRLQEGLRGSDSDAEEADLLRRLQEHHRRRAGG